MAIDTTQAGWTYLYRCHADNISDSVAAHPNSYKPIAVRLMKIKCCGATGPPEENIDFSPIVI